MTTIPARLTIVTLGVRDFSAMKSFYDGLGYRASVEMDTFAMYVLGGVGLGLFPVAELALEAGAAEAPDPGDWRGFSLALNLDERDQVDGVWGAWVEAGATPVTSPEDRPWGGRTGYVADPEGNRWEIAWAPGAAFDERGALTRFGAE